MYALIMLAGFQISVLPFFETKELCEAAKEIYLLENCKSDYKDCRKGHDKPYEAFCVQTTNY